jgi:uncharacterized membrane protein
LDYPSNTIFGECSLTVGSRDACIVAGLVAVGAVCRIGLGEIALPVPVPLYGILIKVGLTETLTFVSGFAFGPALGFLSGVLIIIISDLFLMPGLWTLFIAAIIGIFGLGGAAVRRLAPTPSIPALGASMGVLTVLSEFLQNAWIALFFSLPIGPILLSGIPSAVTAVANNIILLSTVGLRIIKFIQEATTRPSVPEIGVSTPSNVGGQNTLVRSALEKKRPKRS